MKNIGVIKTKVIRRLVGLLFAGFVLTVFNGCRPSLGSSWYPRVSDDTGMTMYITEILVADNPVIAVLSESPTDEIDRLKKFSEAATYIVTVPPSVEEVYADNIKIKAVNSLSKMVPVLVDVKINGEGSPLMSGQAVPITIKVVDNEGKYTPIEKIIKITQSEPYNLELKSLEICGIDAMLGDISVPYRYNIIDPSKITAKFKYGENETVIPVDVENSPVELKENETVNIKIMVKGKKGQYKDFEKVIAVTREPKAEGEDEALQLLEMYILGIKAEIGKIATVPENTQSINSDAVILSFKKFGYIPAEINPDPASFGSQDVISLKLSVAAKEGKYQSWEMNLTVKKSSEVLYNPIDKKGNKKYVIKINTILESVDPFDYYNENYDFPASKFDDWVLYMPSMSGIIASYRFTPGSWSGIPNVCNNVPDEIGSGLKAIDNIKIYRYKTRMERWAQHGGFVPAPDSNDSRFYFYRFTANASAGIKADNSMFCADRYSKFLFYYSDPGYLKNILGNIVPQNWMDYAATSSGDHVQFGKPFYMSDPVGYVKEDGSVVMYQWIKDNINASNYHAQENSIFTKPAEKKPNGAGFSPYRNPIEVKKTKITTEINPKYTVAEPIIMGQPSSVYAHVGDDVFFEVKVIPSPEGENLSYQWYKRSNTDGAVDEKIDGAVQAKYVPDTSADIDAYCYCIVKNENTTNGEVTRVKSEEVKFLLVSGSGQIIIDAEPPKILKQPEGMSVAIGFSEEISLSVAAESLDGGNLTYQWYKADNEGDDGSPISDAVTETYKFVPATSEEHNEFYYCVVTNTNSDVNGNTTAIRKSMQAKIAVEALYSITFSVSGDEGGSLTALYKGKPINSGDYVKKGETLRFIATPNPGYYIKQWGGVEPVSSMPDLTIADLVVPDQNIFVSVAFERRMRLKITPKIYNESLRSWSTADGDHFSPKFINGVHMAHNFNVSVQIGGQNINKAWEYGFPYKSGSGGKGDYVQESDFVEAKQYKTYDDEEFINNLFTDFEGLKINLNNYLIKSNRHDYWRTEYTYGIWPFTAPDMYRKQCIDNNSLIPLVYNDSTGLWTVDNSSVNLNQVDADGDGIVDDIPQSPRPAGFENMNPNFTTIPYKNVTIAYDQNFTLAAGEEKDFVITYMVNNPDTKSEGTIKVIYTISWK